MQVFILFVASLSTSRYRCNVLCTKSTSARQRYMPPEQRLGLRLFQTLGGVLFIHICQFHLNTWSPRRRSLASSPLKAAIWRLSLDLATSTCLLQGYYFALLQSNCKWLITQLIIFSRLLLTVSSSLYALISMLPLATYFLPIVFIGLQKETSRLLSVHLYREYNSFRLN